jgi:hypothetical protein
VFITWPRNSKTGAGGMAQVAESMASKQKALSSSTSTTHTQKKSKKDLTSKTEEQVHNATALFTVGEN